LVNFPEKQSSTKAPIGTPPLLSGEKGPSPFKALLTSITFPLLCMPTEIPPPKCAIIKFACSYFIPKSIAAFLAIAFLV